MSTALAYAIKYVESMQDAVRFHRDELGLKLRFESPHWSEFETGGTTLALHLASLEHPPGTCELGFRVADIAAFYAQKSGSGIVFTSPPTPLHGQHLAKFTDTDGAECSPSGKSLMTRSRVVAGGIIVTMSGLIERSFVIFSKCVGLGADREVFVE
jgi:lactoylglutathione lyase